MLLPQLHWDCLPRPGETLVLAAQFQNVSVTPHTPFKRGSTIDLEAKLGGERLMFGRTSAISTISRKGYLLPSEGNGFYAAEYQISPDNQRPEGRYAVVFKAEAPGTVVGTAFVSVDYDPEPVEFLEVYLEPSDL